MTNNINDVERNWIDIYRSITKIFDIFEIQPIKKVFPSFIPSFSACPLNLIRTLSLFRQSIIEIRVFSCRDDFSLEHAVADLVEGLESQRTNAQLWCLYLEFSSWHMSAGELHHLCNAALKNAQSYDLFWTVRQTRARAGKTIDRFDL